ncbi:MAG: hypothetical protein V4561_04325 [Bacteroidota bacterium]|jgi:hypothetical protein
MKSTGMILLGTVLAIGGFALAKRLKREDKEKIKEFVRKKIAGTTGLSLQNEPNVKA